MYGVDGGSGPIRLLLIEQDDSTAERYLQQLRHCLSRSPIIETAGDWEPALRTDAEPRWDAIVFSCEDCDDADQAAVRRFKQRHPQLPVIVLSALGSLSKAVGVMRMGADDFVTKPASGSQIATAIESALGRGGTPVPGGAHDEDGSCERLIGSSPAMQRLKQTIARAAASKATVFLKGESGTGKELCAQAVHGMSPCGSGPLISINCSAIPRELMESEIFGHEKGAFTGATHRREGAAELADGGTLFLDEICEMDLALQAKLLRFVQTGQFTRVGGTRVQTVDVRFICATNKDPLAAVQSGVFRADLFYRLHVLPVALPALRERGHDVVEIARRALAQFSDEEGKSFRRFDAQAEKLLLNYWWPGNVRELLNVIRNVVVMNDGITVTAEMIPLALAQGAVQELAPTVHAGAADFTAARERPAQAHGDLLKPLWKHEQEIIEGAVAACGGSISQAAAHLEINPSTIYRKRRSWLQQGAA